MANGEVCDVRGGSSEGEAACCWKRQKISDGSAGGQQAQQEFKYQHRLLQAGEAGEEVQEDETLWVQCEVCTKWRPMPIGHKVVIFNPESVFCLSSFGDACKGLRLT